jgi:hypothetical protein
MLSTFSVSAQTKKEQDVAAIKQMCGCYRVTFDYAETFSSDTAYEFRDNYSTGAPSEWVFVAEETEDRIVLQHILVINDTMIIKHWRQDWAFEADDLYQYASGMSWNHTMLDSKSVSGQWVQRVFQVDDSPRYEGSATWVHVDGKHYWENTTSSPLPRREYTKRRDYHVMDRTNRHEITDYGWVHEQDNLKVILDGTERNVLAEEKGYNRYYRIDEKTCDAGIKWWNEHEPFWTLVRSEWGEHFDQDRDLHLKKKADEKLLWQALFDLDKKHIEDSNKFTADAARKDIDMLISSYRLEAPEATDATY